jgi:Mn2+/Fe2+ NRAMP family transporter
MSKRTFIFSLLIGFVAGVVLLYIIERSQWLLSWACGVILGIYPFVFWQIAQNILYKLTGYSNGNRSEKKQPKRLPFRYYLLLVIVTFKFIILSVIIIFISKLKFIISTPFLIGFLIMAPIIVIMILIGQLTKYSDKNAVIKERISLS